MENRDGFENVQRRRARQSGSTRGRLLTVLGVVGVIFAVVLASRLTQRLNDQAVAVLVGAMCGMGAGIPISLLVVWVSRLRREQPRPPVALAGGYPPVVVLQPPQVGHHLPDQPVGWQAGLVSGRVRGRQFTVVGGEVEEEPL
jgi:drug/metabolite transporter (DMT)-like permease